MKGKSRPRVLSYPNFSTGLFSFRAESETNIQADTYVYETKLKNAHTSYGKMRKLLLEMSA